MTPNLKSIGPIQQAWYRWKAMKLPWRKKFLIGLDLEGNTFWEFRDSINTSRMRRIIQFQGHGAGRGAGSTPFSDVTGKISPAWHQWLRHTREHPPSLTEQSQDLVRQQQLKILAAQADARWAAKRKIGDAPKKTLLPVSEEDQTTAKVTNTLKPSETDPSRDREKSTRNNTGVDEGAQKNYEDDPWRKAKSSGPSEEWQPESWTPSPARARH